MSAESETLHSPVVMASSESTASHERLLSLDVFRGVTIAAMILVNNPGSWSHVYPPLAHAEWHGWTPTDLIFPFFLFIVGVSLSFALQSPKFVARDSRQRLLFVASRSLKLIGLGLFMAAFPLFELSTLRWPGVLQRIGLCYFAASLLAFYTPPRRLVVGIAAALLGYWAVMAWIPVPGLGDGLDPYSREGNLAAYLDRIVLGRHLWKADYDPEGLLSTVPAVATTLIGFLIGESIRRERARPYRLTARMFAAGWALIVSGLAWSLLIPINKALWSSSYVLFTAGCALHLLALCFYWVDVAKWRAGVDAAIVFGRNAIAVFVLSGLLGKTLMLTRIRPSGTGGEEITAYEWIYRSAFAGWLGALPGSLAFAICTVAFWWLLMWLLHRRRIYLSV